MNLYLHIVKPLLKYKLYQKYYPYLNLPSLEKNKPEIYRLFQCLPLLHKDSEKDFSIDDLQVVLFSNYPKADETLYGKLFAELRDTEVNEALLEGYISKAVEREKAMQLARLAVKAAEGDIDFDEVEQRYKSFTDTVPEVEDWRSSIVKPDLEKIHSRFQADNGFRWRLNSLNQALGSLRKANFGFIFARPETGKTTLLASELTYMAPQVKPGEGPIVWFNNEQGGEDVFERIFQAALGITREELYGNKEAHQRAYDELIGDKLVLIDDGSLSKRKIEEICKALRPSLIVFDQIDNIKGFAADRPDLEFKEIYQWARELAKIYGPVIGICQAGASGEDKKWLTMNDVDSSKTSKQGAADWILGVGKIHEQGLEQVRFLHLSKNKLPGDSDSISSERHGKWQTLIHPEIARYGDI